MAMITFKVENDKGDMVNKSASLRWVKNTIRRKFFNATGKNIGAFTVQVREQKDNPGFFNEILVKNKKGQSMLYYYGGFDGHEVIEPQSHDDWFKIKETA